MLNDRKCESCGFHEEDLVENLATVQLSVIVCPACLEETFRKIWRPIARIYMDGAGAISALDNIRAQAAAGHGNESFKA